MSNMLYYDELSAEGFIRVKASEYEELKKKNEELNDIALKERCNYLERELVCVVKEKEKLNDAYAELKKKNEELYKELDDRIYKKNDYEDQLAQYKDCVKVLETKIAKLNENSNDRNLAIKRLNDMNERLTIENSKLKAIVKAVETIFGGKILEDC